MLPSHAFMCGIHFESFSPNRQQWPTRELNSGSLSLSRLLFHWKKFICTISPSISVFWRLRKMSGKTAFGSSRMRAMSQRLSHQLQSDTCMLQSQRHLAVFAKRAREPVRSYVGNTRFVTSAQEILRSFRRQRYTTRTNFLISQFYFFYLNNGKVVYGDLRWHLPTPLRLRLNMHTRRRRLRLHVFLRKLFVKNKFPISGGNMSA